MKFSNKQLHLIISILEAQMEKYGRFGWNEKNAAKLFMKKYPSANSKSVEEVFLKAWRNNESFLAHRYSSPKTYNPSCPNCENNHLKFILGKNKNIEKCFWGQN